MTRAVKKITFSLPSDLADEIDKIIEKEGKNRDEILKDALKLYVEKKEWQRIYSYGEMKAKENKITEEQIEDIVDAKRK